jgi:hypothetical protein
MPTPFDHISRRRMAFPVFPHPDPMTHIEPEMLSSPPTQDPMNIDPATFPSPPPPSSPPSPSTLPPSSSTPFPAFQIPELPSIVRMPGSSRKRPREVISHIAVQRHFKMDFVLALYNGDWHAARVEDIVQAGGTYLFLSPTCLTYLRLVLHIFVCLL